MVLWGTSGEGRLVDAGSNVYFGGAGALGEPPAPGGVVGPDGRNGTSGSDGVFGDHILIK